jgi:hypothetical protein
MGQRFFRAADFFDPFFDRAAFFAADFDFVAVRFAERREAAVVARRARFATRFTVRLTARRAGLVRSAVMMAISLISEAAEPARFAACDAVFTAVPNAPPMMSAERESASGPD